jgi:hypothetical protein
VSTEHRLRLSFLGLGAASSLGTGVELAFQRHWGSPTRIIPWVVLALLLVAIAIVATTPTVVRLRVSRAISVTAVGASLIGVWQHIRSNYQIAPLQRQHADTWASRSAISRIWQATAGGVDPSAPSLAPFALVVAGACVWLATSWRRAEGDSHGEEVRNDQLGEPVR